MITTVAFTLSAFCLFMVFRPYQSQGNYDLGSIFRILWLVPLAIIWAAYFLVRWLMG